MWERIHYVVLWLSFFGLNWTYQLRKIGTVHWNSLLTGVLFSAPIYWALLYRLRPAVHAHQARIGGEEGLYEWVDSMMILAAKMVSFGEEYAR